MQAKSPFGRRGWRPGSRLFARITPLRGPDPNHGTVSRVAALVGAVTGNVAMRVRAPLVGALVLRLQSGGQGM